MEGPGGPADAETAVQPADEDMAAGNAPAEDASAGNAPAEDPPVGAAAALVAFEGIDGSGKTTVARRVHEALTADGVDAVLTREPTETPLGRRVRDAVAARTHPVAQALLFMADHRQHTERVRGLLDEGRHVLSDRWNDSCYAYQAATLEETGAVEDPMTWLMAGMGADDLRPDRVVLLDLPVEAALARVGDRGDVEAEGFERGELLERVRANYHRLADRFGNYVVVDASGGLEAVVAEAEAAVRAVVAAGVGRE